MMVFDNLKPENLYLGFVKDIIRRGIAKEKGNLKLKDNEDLKNQQLAEVFNIIGSQNEKMPIFSAKEHTRRGTTKREDIYFYLDDDNRTRVFYVEGKRLPKITATAKIPHAEEYVAGQHRSGNASGGIERYKLGYHGEPTRLESNALIAYIEKETISKWKKIVDKSIINNYPFDTRLLQKAGRINEFTSSHKYKQSEKRLIMHHFWIDITKNK